MLHVIKMLKVLGLLGLTGLLVPLGDLDYGVSYTRVIRVHDISRQTSVNKVPGLLKLYGVEARQML
jgi:hypothetical protein